MILRASQGVREDYAQFSEACDRPLLCLGLFCGWRAGKEKMAIVAPRARGIKLQKSQTPDNAG